MLMTAVLYDSIKQMERIDSPCVRKCCLDDKDICLGCFRSLIEITNWTLVDEETKQVFLNNAVERKSQQDTKWGR